MQDIRQAERKHYIIEFRRVTDESTHLMNAELSSMDWNSILPHWSAVDAFTRFHETWMLLLNEYFPEIRKKIPNQKKPHTNDDEISRLKARLDILQTIKKSQRTKGAYEAYNKIKAEYISKIDQKNRIENENVIR